MRLSHEDGDREESNSITGQKIKYIGLSQPEPKEDKDERFISSDGYEFIP